MLAIVIVFMFQMMNVSTMTKMIPWCKFLNDKRNADELDRRKHNAVILTPGTIHEYQDRSLEA